MRIGTGLSRVHPRGVAIVLAAAAILAGACASGGAAKSPPSPPKCETDSDTAGVLEVLNSSGRIVEIRAARPDGSLAYLGEASPGTTMFIVPGPDDLGVYYGVIDANAGRLINVVSWIRPRSRGPIVQLGLYCRR